MTLCNALPWILKAQQEHWAMGAFNANTLEQIQAIVQAAQEEHAPAIIQISLRALQYAGWGNATLGLRYLAQAAQTAAQSVTVPVAIHIDHAPEMLVLQAIALGFTSVMLDGDGLAYPEHITATQRICAIAHPLGICVESEVGEVPRLIQSGQPSEGSKVGGANGTNGTYGTFAADKLTEPQQAAEFVQATGVDTLAIALGSVHAVREKIVSLDLKRLEAIRCLIDIPLVLHGSSGVKDAHIVQGIQMGLCKVNVATQLNQSFTKAILASFSQHPDQVDPRLYLGPARLAMVTAIRERMILFGASGKAGD